MTTATPASDLQTFLGPNPTIERLYDNVQVEAPGAVLEAIKLVAWNAIEDFFIRSTVKRELVFWKMNPGVLTINFDPFDANWRIAHVLGFCGLSNGRIDPPALLRDLNTNPAQRDGEILLALRPASFASKLPDDLWARWFETILAGTLYRLQMQPAKPYTDLNMAKLNAAKFTSGVGAARAAAQQQFSANGGRWRFPYFARGRRQ